MRILLLCMLLMLYACNDKKQASKEINRIDASWLDSIKRRSDTSWTKPYRNNEFVSAEYYIDKKDSVVTQLMKDASGTIRQIIIARYNQVRLFFAEYYANGQLMARLPLDSAGRYEGKGIYYYENGLVKTEGLFSHGLYSGKWKNYDAAGKLIATEEYDANGQLLKTMKE